MKFGVVLFPGSNSDYDAFYVANDVVEQEARIIWHKETSVGDVDVIIIPGGFAHGDYLRCGAIARFSPIMKDVVRFANEGGLVIGFCNGFQILCESGLLPGALMRNASLRFVCKQTILRTEHVDTPFTFGLQPKELMTIPVAHGEGNYYASEEELDALEANKQVIFRYVDEAGEATPEANPNGSARNIAGIINEQGNVLGMMPHPERCAEALLIGTGEGVKIFESIVAYLKGAEVVA
ncbi:MAG: phosphoribosylformylglycinamidine synthase subunit PurQ [Rhodothermales bacterium]